MLVPLQTLPGWPAAPDPTPLQTLGLLAGALLCSLLASTASAHFVEGSVFCTDSAGCPATPTKPLVGYWVAATGEQAKDLARRGVQLILCSVIGLLRMGAGEFFNAARG